MEKIKELAYYVVNMGIEVSNDYNTLWSGK